MEQYREHFNFHHRQLRYGPQWVQDMFLHEGPPERNFLKWTIENHKFLNDYYAQCNDETERINIQYGMDKIAKIIDELIKTGCVTTSDDVEDNMQYNPSSSAENL